MVDDDSTQIQRIRPRSARDDAPCVVVLTGQSMGRVYKLNSEGTVVGRAHDCDIPLVDDGISRVHCIFLNEGNGWVVKDLNSTNGTYVAERTVGEAPFEIAEGQRVRLGVDLILRFGRQDEIERQFLDHLYRSATRDALTGLVNRRLFMERLESELPWHHRHEETLSLLFIDIDHFKQINDSYGHTRGDQVLVGVAKLLSDGTRTEDVVARYGGEEFVVLLRQTSGQVATQIAERFRRSVESHTFRLDRDSVKVTVSIGIVSRSGDELVDSTDLLHEADSSLYAAKEGGRNRVVAARR